MFGNDKHIIDIKSNPHYSVALDKNGNVYVAGVRSNIFFADKDIKLKRMIIINHGTKLIHYQINTL